MRVLLLLLALAISGHGDPPFSGTVWVDPDIVTAADPTAFESVSYSGRGMRTIYDRRPAAWIQVNAYLFEVAFSDGTTAEFIVNPEFGSESAARVHVDAYAPPIGRLSTYLRKDMREVWINGGDAAFGGGNNSILIHTEYGQRTLRNGFIEEVLIHEAGHTSMDAEHAQAEAWLAAQAADGDFISTYARDNSIREDIAESILPYFAYRYRSDRITDLVRQQIESAIPNRIAYLDGLGLDWSPMLGSGTGVDAVETPGPLALKEIYPNPATHHVDVQVEMQSAAAVSVQVFDLAGRLVLERAMGSQAAGTVDLSLDVRSLPAGLYVVSVAADGRRVARILAVTR
ncbi:MAG: T9SS type A sorting domain-containing protein [Rhodothermales bacterium]|nr:T9SS type A sorting domain-containing protein [Rhodothermales bacterium]MBO6778039.1 T9SS type A sorting domain-containing protein [Rhodothermales bacterium]